MIKTGIANEKSDLFEKNKMLVEVLRRKSPLDYESYIKDARMGRFCVSGFSNSLLNKVNTSNYSKSRIRKANPLTAKKKQPEKPKREYVSLQQVMNQDAQLRSYNTNYYNNDPFNQDMTVYDYNSKICKRNQKIAEQLQNQPPHEEYNTYQQVTSQEAQLCSFNRNNYNPIYQDVPTYDKDKINRFVAKQMQQPPIGKIGSYQQVSSQTSQLDNFNTNNHNPAYQTQPMFGNTHISAPKNTSTMIHEDNKSDFALLKELAEEYIRDQGFNILDTDTTNAKQYEYDNKFYKHKNKLI
ncbi:hypothetical protein BDAP_002320 [Binucleata daphniae]